MTSSGLCLRPSLRLKRRPSIDPKADPRPGSGHQVHHTKKEEFGFHQTKPHEGQEEPEDRGSDRYAQAEEEEKLGLGGTHVIHAEEQHQHPHHTDPHFTGVGNANKAKDQVWPQNEHGAEDLQRYNTTARSMNPFVAMQPWQGALPTLRAATAPDGTAGEYHGPHGFMEMRGYPVKVGTTKAAKDKDLARRLWRVSEEMTGVRFEA